MPNWPADDAPPPRGWAWTRGWVLACVALWPLPGPAEAVLALGALAVAAQWLATAARGGVLPLDRCAAWLVAVLFAGYWLPELLSLPDALDRPRALKEVLADLRYLPFLAGVAIAVRGPAGRRQVGLGLAGVAALWTLDALAQVLAGASPLFAALDAARQALAGGPLCPAQAALAAGRVNGVFGACNPKLGQALAVLAPFLLAAAARRGAAAWCGTALVAGAVVALAGARAAWVMYALVLLGSGWHALGARRLLAFAAAALLGLACLYLAAPPLRERVAQTTLALQGGGLDAALAGRVRIWQGAACMAAAHPLNGVGVRGFRVAWPACDPAPEQAPAWGGGGAYHAHQLLLEVLSETGALGLLLWLGAAWAAWRAWCGAGADVRRQARPAALALGVAVFPLNTHLAAYSSFWGGVLLLLAGLYAGALHGGGGAAQRGRS